jgi:hypothetical protein
MYPAHLLTLLAALALLLAAPGCPVADDDDTDGPADDDVTDDDTGGDDDSAGTPGDDDDSTGDDDSASDDDSADDDDWDCYANPLETIPGADGSLLARGSVDGEETWFVVDTAAQVIFADFEISDDFNGYFPADVQIGPIDLEQWLIKGRDLSPNEAFIGVDIGCLLGQEVMMSAYTVVDTATPQIYLCDAIPPTSPPGTSGAPAVHPYTLTNQFPLIEVDVGLAAPIPLLVDSGQPVTYVTEEIFDQLDDGAPRLYGWVYETQYGFDEGFVSRLPTLAFGDDVLEELEVVVLPTDHHMDFLLEASGVVIDGFLGNTVLDRYLLGINGIDSTFELWPLEGGWIDDDRWIRVGIEPAWRDGSFVVEFLLWPSHAQEQGIAVDDVILAIDGVDTAGLELAEVHTALRGTAGETRTLSMDGAQGTYEVEVQVQDLLPY